MFSWIVFLCLFVFSDQRSTSQDATYVAAVVEYQVSRDTDYNLRQYGQLIEQAAQQDADIVVFPEMTLSSGDRAITVPIYGLLTSNPVPASSPTLYDDILVNISSVARQHQVYVVINIQEQLNCSEPQAPEEYCPEARRYLFNTNVVFDRNGAIIDRYRKINLFGEFTRTPALRPELGLFTTDFGVTFGHFICFDLAFQVPAIQVVQKNNITDVVFSTMWFSELPYLTAVEIQEAYAYANNVNFIAAGANNPSVGSSGSGIYSGKAGALVSTMTGVSGTRLLVSRVPKVPGQVTFPTPGPIIDTPSDQDRLILIRDPSVPSHVTKLLVPGFQEFTLVDKEVSCRFRVRMNRRNGSQGHFYRAMVHDGMNKHLQHDVGVASCGVIACQTVHIDSCPYRFNAVDKTQEIEELSIQMTTYRLQYNETLQCNNIVYFPTTLQSNLLPLISEKLKYGNTHQNGGQEQNGRAHLTMELKEPQEDLVVFGIYGRLFNKDILRKKKVTEKDIEDYMKFEDWIYSGNKNDKTSNEMSNDI